MNTVRLKAYATLATLALACEGGTAPTPRQVPELDLGSSAPLADAGPADAALPDAEPVDAAPPDAALPLGGVPALGSTRHTMDAVRVDVLATRADGLRVPRDLALDPENPQRLWVVNREDDSVVILHDVDDPDALREKRIDPYALHFMDEVSSIEFGEPGLFGTCQESVNTYNGLGEPNDFMGPTLWSSDLEIFGFSNPDAVDYVGEDLGSHLDMLHESPLCMGIAWERGNIYWTFDGKSQSITRANFMEDHGIGYDDHGDGRMQRFVEGEVRRVAGVPSHMVYDGQTDLLYVADTGNRRVAVLDTTEARSMGRIETVEPGTVLWQMQGATLTTLADDAGAGLERPSGIALHRDLLYVTDNETGRITALTLSGEVVDWLDTALEPGALMGIELDAAGRIYVVDAVRDRILRLSPR